MLGKRLPYDSLAALRQALFKAHPHLLRVGQIAPGDAADLQKLAALGGTADKAPFALERRGFLFHQSDRALLGGDGGMLGACARARDHDGGGVGR